MANKAVAVCDDSANNKAAQIRYKLAPVNNTFLFSLISITCPAYNAHEMAGTTSDNPMMPIAKGALVNSYIHQPTNVPIMRKPMMKKNLPNIKFLNSLILTAAKGSWCCESGFILSVNFVQQRTKLILVFPIEILLINL